MKTLFEIKISGNTMADVMLGEVGKDFCCFAFGDGASGNLKSLRYYSLEKDFLPDVLPQLINDNLHDKKGEKLVLCSAYPEALMVPNPLFKEAEGADLLSSVYNITGCAVKNDAVNEWQLHTLYAFPEKVHHALGALFNTIEYVHAYTVSLKVRNDFSGENQLSVHFTPKQFSVLLKKGGDLQLVQTYAYTAPLDVVYYLLKIIEAFNLSQEETYIITSGLIEEDSVMYKELKSYFINVHCAVPPAATLLQQYPPHFFQSMYNLAACVL